MQKESFLLFFVLVGAPLSAMAQYPLPPVWERSIELPLRAVDGGPAHLAGPGPAPPPREGLARDRNPSLWRHLVGRRDLPIPDSELEKLAERERTERQGGDGVGWVTPRSLGPAAPR